MDSIAHAGGASCTTHVDVCCGSRAAVAAALAVRPVYARKLPTYRVRPIRLPWASGLNRSRGRVLRGLLGRGPKVGIGASCFDLDGFRQPHSRPSCLDLDGFRQPHSRREINPHHRTSNRPIAAAHDHRPHDPHARTIVPNTLQGYQRP